jgi:hypothetical protein
MGKLFWFFLVALSTGLLAGCGSPSELSDSPVGAHSDAPSTAPGPITKVAPETGPDHTDAAEKPEPTRPVAAPHDRPEMPPGRIPFDPLLHGLSFANFSGGAGASAIEVIDLVEIFGRRGLCEPADTEVCTPYPGVTLFLSRLNEVLANGVCYGISATSSNYFGGEIPLGDQTSESTDLIAFKRSDELESTIAKLHVMQYTMEYREVLDHYLALPPHEVALELAERFAALEGKLTPPFTLALYSAHGGHSVTPIRMEKTEKGHRVFVYDSNWPTETRWVDFDRPTNSWSYQAMESDKASTRNMWAGEGPGSVALIPHEIPTDNFECFFCQTGSSDLARSSGSILLVDTEDIENTGFTIVTETGDALSWRTGGRSPGLQEIKTYLLPSEFQPDRTTPGALLVFIPATVGGFEVALFKLAEDAQPARFSILVAGSDMATTTVQGSTTPSIGDRQDKFLKISKTPDLGRMTVSVDAPAVELVRGATLRSTSFVEPSEGEIYEAHITRGILDDVRVLDRETAQEIYSLRSVLQDVVTPLRVTETGDGTTFAKFDDGSIKVESADKDLITKAKDTGYEVEFSDGTTASFEIDEKGAMVGVFSDGSTSMRFEAGNGIHSTAEGWIIDEHVRGSFRIFRELADGVFETPSPEDLAEFPALAQETSEFMRRVMVAGSSGGEATEPGPDGPALAALAEQMEAMSEKYGFLKRIRDQMATQHPEGITPQGILQDMLKMMGDGMWSTKNVPDGMPAMPDGMPAMPDGTPAMPYAMPATPDEMPARPSMY